MTLFRFIITDLFFYFQELITEEEINLKRSFHNTAAWFEIFNNINIEKVGSNKFKQIPREEFMV